MSKNASSSKLEPTLRDVLDVLAITNQKIDDLTSALAVAEQKA